MIIRDVVVKGRGLGTKLGYPTANLAHRHGVAQGVYRVRVNLPAPLLRKEGTLYDSILIVGAFTRADGTPAEEVHILHFAGDLYGQEITLEVFEKIRDMQTFTNDEELKVVIQKDIDYVHGYHQASGGSNSE